MELQEYNDYYAEVFNNHGISSERLREIPDEMDKKYDLFSDNALPVKLPYNDTNRLVIPEFSYLRAKIGM